MKLTMDSLRAALAEKAWEMTVVCCPEDEVRITEMLEQTHGHVRVLGRSIVPAGQMYLLDDEKIDAPWSWPGWDVRADLRAAYEEIENEHSCPSCGVIVGQTFDPSNHWPWCSSRQAVR